MDRELRIYSKWPKEDFPLFPKGFTYSAYYLRDKLLHVIAAPDFFAAAQWAGWEENKDKIETPPQL